MYSSKNTVMFRSYKFVQKVSLLLFWSTATAEWVEMPQFSDETKIYRIPSGKYDQFHKFIRNDGQGQLLYGNNSKTRDDYNHDFSKDYLTVTETLNLQLIQPTSVPTRTIPTTQAIRVDPTKYTSTEDYNNVNAMKNSTMSKHDTLDVEGEKIYEFDETGPSFASEDYAKRHNYRNDSSKKSDGNFLEYLPVDVLKNVHRILKSQPTTMEGKIHFLKSFEETLMSEIEFRLGETLAPTRKARGVHEHHYDHGYDEYEEHGLGFPSIEGALMAISFLTFAVYLVRLVMLLFRNTNNTNNNNTNGTPTVFVGRRKRSESVLNENTARILTSIETFISNYT